MTGIGRLKWRANRGRTSGSAASIVHQRRIAVKVHSDYLDGRIQNTEVELESNDPAMDRYIDRILDEFGLLVCGWSGKRGPAFRAAVERCPSRRYATYWTGTGAPGPKAAGLVHLRGTQFIEIEDADEFFENLLEKVASPDKMGAADPLSVDAAVASLKRYVAEPRFRVRFDDLLADGFGGGGRATHRAPDGCASGRRWNGAQAFPRLRCLF